MQDHLLDSPSKGHTCSPKLNVAADLASERPHRVGKPSLRANPTMSGTFLFGFVVYPTDGTSLSRYPCHTGCSVIPIVRATLERP